MKKAQNFQIIFTVVVFSYNEVYFLNRKYAFQGSVVQLPRVSFVTFLSSFECMFSVSWFDLFPFRSCKISRLSSASRVPCYHRFKRCVLPFIFPGLFLISLSLLPSIRTFYFVYFVGFMFSSLGSPKLVLIWCILLGDTMPISSSDDNPFIISFKVFAKPRVRVCVRFS